MTQIPQQQEADRDLIADAMQREAAGRMQQAEALYRRVLSRTPDNSDALHLLGRLGLLSGNYGPALELVRRAVMLRPGIAQYRMTYGNVLLDIGRLDEAIDQFEAASQLKADLRGPHNNRGVALRESGRIDEAIESFRAALTVAPDDHGAWGNFLYGLHFHPGWTGEAILREHQRWAREVAAPLAPIKAPTPAPSSDGRLRIGYVSADLGDHPVGWFMLPILLRHDRARFHVTCYSDRADRDDVVTQRIRPVVDSWVTTGGQSDAQVADRIRADNIDLLIDLALHSGGNRMLVFARKPAPVQATYLGYPGTTGLATVDYRITDAHLDPPGESDGLYVEKSIRLTNSFWCFSPREEFGDVGPLPAKRNGFVTFGCLNHYGKVSDPCALAWVELLASVPESRLLVYAVERQHLDRVRRAAQINGVDPARVLHSPRKRAAEYLTTYNDIDIGLDPFPYCGGTTSCDALYMGVPIVTLSGDVAVRRAGVTLLANLGMNELVANSPRQYAQIAADLARDLERLAAIRAGLRDRMKRSPLMDADRFTHDLESAYRAMWERRQTS